MVLNDEQLKVIEYVNAGDNIFLSGSPGSGKSFCIESIIETLKLKNVGITAMTGSAAILINGTTLHSFLGIGLAKDDPYKIILKMVPEKYKTIKNLDCLLIDECSMLSDILFEKINQIVKIIKNNELYFGGIQLILVGDGFQLGPIEGTYFFLSKIFIDFKTIILKQNMRQRNDKNFKNLLDRVKLGNCCKEDFYILKSLSDTIFPCNIVPTKLFSKNIDVDLVNSIELVKLNTPKKDYNLCYKNHESKKYVETNKIPLKIILGIGAQVVITRNISFENCLVNGTRGIVVELHPQSVSIKTTDEKTVTIGYYNFNHKNIIFSYLPLKLAWATTIHSSQGMTLDALEIDLGDTFACGQSYTGLSRAKDFKSIRVSNISKNSFKTNISVIDFYNKINKKMYAYCVSPCLNDNLDYEKFKTIENYADLYFVFIDLNEKELFQEKICNFKYILISDYINTDNYKNVNIFKKLYAVYILYNQYNYINYIDHDYIGDVIYPPTKNIYYVKLLPVDIKKNKILYESLTILTPNDDFNNLSLLSENFTLYIKWSKIITYDCKLLTHFFEWIDLNNNLINFNKYIYDDILYYYFCILFYNYKLKLKLN